MDAMPQQLHPRLIIVFNHRYDQNIPKLEQIYRERFDDIRYLVPFYRGDRQDVIPVFESSAQFSGYLAQAARSIVEDRFTHYVFCADDLLLNADLNERNLLQEFGVGPNDGYIKSMTSLSEVSLEWPYIIDVLGAWQFEKYTLYRRELPSFEQAERKLASHGLKTGRITWRNLRHWDGTWRRYWGIGRCIKYLAKRRGSVPLPYPMCQGYSDLVIVPRAAMADFCHLCGVFAAMGVWVEAAIPTALALACDRIVTLKDTGREVLEIWDAAQLEAFENKADHQVQNVFTAAGPNTLYVHPVKLSRWALPPVAELRPEVAR